MNLDLVKSYQFKEDSWQASLLLAFLASAGLYYINIFPAIIDALMQGAQLSAVEAGKITSANALGAAFGALMITLLIRLIPRWKLTAACMLLTLISIDIFTILQSSVTALVPLRFCHGFIGGALVGLGFSVIARTSKPSVAFSLLIVVQYSGGALGLWQLPPLVPIYGTYVPFYALITFSSLTLCMLPFLGAYPLPNEKLKSKKTAAVKVKPLLLTLIALFLFQAANMALFAFIFGLGKFFSHDMDFLSPVIGITNIIAILGAILAIYTGAKFKLCTPLTIALVVAVLGTWLLIFSESGAIFLVVNAVVGIAWAFSVPYFLTMAAKFDAAGQMAALGGFASKMGLATGPLVAGYLLSEPESYLLLINVATLALALCVLVAIYPARLLDKKALI
ncbi:Predicted arabinose efflux permease, MFS family [Colwellia chukchiensis]|uniref:Predicted arabinose efflux permease, MFS family n=1 Tax=Colwellia chukchiensis TaxID=641665 RepID=A0A1H7SID7_9GAMM|nr:MFS transporter [Colwellia chukchiensis]SEL72283.1 Predicted arabinose efflux permease, MFS family [Colwellia chukchiensis]